MKENKRKFFVGKVSDLAKAKGWFFGHFMNEDLLCSNLVEIAWKSISCKKPYPFDKHYHKHSVEINIVISGWVRLAIDGEKFKVKKGEFYVVYPFATIESIETGKNTELIVVRAPSLPRDKFLD